VLPEPAVTKALGWPICRSRSARIGTPRRPTRIRPRAGWRSRVGCLSGMTPDGQRVGFGVRWAREHYKAMIVLRLLVAVWIVFVTVFACVKGHWWGLAFLLFLALDLWLYVTLCIPIVRTAGDLASRCRRDPLASAHSPRIIATRWRRGGAPKADATVRKRTRFSSSGSSAGPVAVRRRSIGSARAA
jgi:hypothetical protein